MDYDFVVDGLRDDNAFEQGFEEVQHADRRQRYERAELETIGSGGGIFPLPLIGGTEVSLELFC